MEDNYFKELIHYTAFSILNNLVVKRYNELFWTYFREIFCFALENKVEGFNEIEILKKIAECEFPPSITLEIEEILTKTATNSFW
jgi:hypothetical protein